jgi:hypothetical protein
VEDENGDLLADTHNTLKRSKNNLSQLLNASLGRYSSLADSDHGIGLFVY